MEADVGGSGSTKVALVAGDFETWKVMTELKGMWPSEFEWLYPYPGFMQQILYL